MRGEVKMESDQVSVKQSWVCRARPQKTMGANPGAAAALPCLAPPPQLLCFCELLRSSTTCSQMVPEGL